MVSEKKSRKRDESEKSPEELEALIERLNSQIKEHLSEIEKLKAKSISDAVFKLGKDFSDRYERYVATRDRVKSTVDKIEKLSAEVNIEIPKLRTERDFIHDSLVNSGVRHEWVDDILGHTVEDRFVGTYKITGRRKVTRAKLPDGTVLTWTELLDKYGIEHKEGQSAHREWDAAKIVRKDLPDIEVVAV